MAVWIAEWAWDDDAIEHLARHGVTPWDVYEVWEGTPKYRANRRGRAATHQMIGPTKGGAVVAAFIVEVPGVPGRWRPVTARPATRAEREWWERS